VTTNFRVKIGEIGVLTYICRLAFQNRMEYRNSDSNVFMCENLSTLCKILINFDPETSEIKMLTACTPLFSVVQILTLKSQDPWIDFQQIFTLW